MAREWARSRGTRFGIVNAQKRTVLMMVPEDEMASRIRVSSKGRWGRPGLLGIKGCMDRATCAAVLVGNVKSTLERREGLFVDVG